MIDLVFVLAIWTIGFLCAWREDAQDAAFEKFKQAVSEDGQFKLAPWHDD